MKTNHQRLVILKGKNIVKKEEWKGMPLNINYIGVFSNEKLGIARKKITKNDIFFQSTIFTNERLNSINRLIFPMRNFQSLDVKKTHCNSSSNQSNYYDQSLQEYILFTQKKKLKITKTESRTPINYEKHEKHHSKIPSENYLIASRLRNHNPFNHLADNYFLSNTIEPIDHCITDNHSINNETELNFIHPKKIKVRNNRVMLPRLRCLDPKREELL